MASVYASASLHEGFGVPLIEAMASGVPVVASCTTAHPWVIGDAGLLVEPDCPEAMADKIVQVLTDDGLYGSLVSRGIARAREFSLDSYYDGWRQIVREATAWLPDQPYPRPSSLLAQPLESNGSTEGGKVNLLEALLVGELGRLKTLADVMYRDYEVRSSIPIIGSLIASVRRNITSHLRGPYIDPTFERQVTFNQHMIEKLEEVVRLCGDISRRIDDIESRVDTLERRLEKTTLHENNSNSL
jgi:hypothetical protein